MDEHNNQSGKIEKTLSQLEWIMLETERIISTRQITVEESQKMSQYLTEMRLLLDELTRYQAWFGNSGSNVFSRTSLVLRFLELEGKVKEIRNDLTKIAREKNLPAG